MSHSSNSGTGVLPPRGSSLENLQPDVSTSTSSAAPQPSTGGKKYKMDPDLLFAYLSLVWLLAQQEQRNLENALESKPTDQSTEDGDRDEEGQLSRNSSLTSLTEEEQINTDFEEPEKPMWQRMKSLIGVGADAVKDGHHPAVVSYQQWKQHFIHGISMANELSEKEQDLVLDVADHGVTIESLTKSLNDTFRKAMDVSRRTDDTDATSLTGAAPSTTDAVTLILSNMMFSSLQASVVDYKQLVYDARLRVLLLKLAEAMCGPGEGDEDKKRALMVQEVEHNVAQLLWEESQSANSTSGPVERSEKEKDKWKRWTAIGLGTVGAGVAVGLTGGLAAPFIGVGLGSLLSGIGLGAQVGLLATLGTTTGAALVGTVFGLTGGGLSAYKFNRRLGALSVFEFRPLTPVPAVTSESATSQSLHLIIPVSGWLESEQDIVDPWSILPAYTPFSEVTALAFDPHELIALGNGLQDFVKSSAVTYVGGTVLKQTLMAGLISALAWPVALLQIGYLVDNPWSIGLDRAKKAGIVLANDVIAKYVQGRRPVTLIGWSLGARVIFYCLLQLAKLGAFGLVDNAYLLGSPVGTSTRDWTAARSVVAGRFVNAYSTQDWVLAYLYRATELSGVAGLKGAPRVNGLENVNVSALVSSHVAYKNALGDILDKVQFERKA
ncbi:hypothetical protein HDU87_005934 [Geranomyces variabilis]|uniref:DUF726-domain-containing protein n=1 Tax=Geranomyces variabilis TaxID=109894 RepID=A0AAD5XU05_9FUNG|nr:hypothetical protein HDU87_005934 [Geranomyces variabilis]